MFALCTQAVRTRLLQVCCCCSSQSPTTETQEGPPAASAPIKAGKSQGPSWAPDQQLST